MNTFEMAKALYSATDEAFAEVFAYLNRIYKEKGLVLNDDSLKQEDMDFNVDELTCWIAKSLKEIIFSEEMDTSAWWKNDKFFGRNTPKVKFQAQTPEFQSRRLMETAMTMNNIYNRMVREGKIFDGGINADVYDVICDLAREFEETFFETDEYEDDYVAVIEKWFPEKHKELFGVEEESA